MKNKEIYVKCDCFSEVLNVEYDEETKTFSVCIYTDFPDKLTFRNRCRFIWRIIKTGKPYGDQMIIHYTKAEDLADFINEIKAQREAYDAAELIKSKTDTQTEERS